MAQNAVLSFDTSLTSTLLCKRQHARPPAAQLAIRLTTRSHARSLLLIHRQQHSYYYYDLWSVGLGVSGENMDLGNKQMYAGVCLCVCVFVCR